MFQIAFGFLNDYEKTGPVHQALRYLIGLFDMIVFWLIKIVYQIIFLIADSQIIDSTIVKEFYGRVQLILGVFMIFKLSVSILQVIINPELLTDQKQGFGKIITRVIIMLGLYISIIPLNIPKEDAPEGSYNAYLVQDGLLFGTLYSLQARILEGHTIEKLFFEVDSNTTLTDGKAANDMATYILKIFVSKNRLCKSNEGKDKTGSHSEWTTYDNPNSTSLEIMNNINSVCNDKPLGAKTRFSFAYFPIISTLCGIVLLVTLIGFCIDIAIRSLKLAVLRLIAPIPIISYIDPKSSEKGAFANWMKALISTYLDLFIRLAVLYFVIFIVHGIMENGISGLSVPVNNGDLNPVGVFATLFIILGLFHFVRMAPTFITQALGLQGMMSNVGLSGILAGAGALFQPGGNRSLRDRVADAHEAGRNASRAQVDAIMQGKRGPGMGESFTSGRDFATQQITGNDKMTARQAARGRRILNNMGITEKSLEDAKFAKFDAADEFENAKAMRDRFNNGTLTTEDRQAIEQQYRKDKGITTGPLSADQVSEMNSAAYLNSIVNKKGSLAGKAAKKYDDMNKEAAKYGMDTSYRTDRYAATRSNASFSDAIGLNGRAAQDRFFTDATGSHPIRTTARSVAGSFRNLGQDVRTGLDSRRTERVASTNDLRERENNERNTARGGP